MTWVNGRLRRRVRDKARERKREESSEGKRRRRKYGMTETNKWKEIQIAFFCNFTTSCNIFLFICHFSVFNLDCFHVNI